MERTKRRQQNNIVQDYHGNKKRKLQHQNDTSNKSLLENLPNEILYEIFEYLCIHHVYNGFLNLNKRFKSLLINSTLPIQINISTMSKSSFEHYNKNIILPNKHRINILRLSNPFTVDVVFSPPRIISKFLRLEKLILDNIDAKYLNNILNQSIHLPKLHSLVLTLTDCLQHPDKLFFRIFRLPKLKYCKLTYRATRGLSPSIICFNECQSSPIEHLVINANFRINSFHDFLSCLPQLRHLSIDHLIGFDYVDMKLCPVESKHLKYISFNVDSIFFNEFEQLAKYFFGCIEVLHIKAKYNQSYLDAKRWEQLILSYLPNLRIFDFNYDNEVSLDSPAIYHDLLNQFTSRFWTDRRWFFTHKHDSQGKMETGVFYSTNPYRRKDYKFYWELDKQICPYVQETHLNPVKHVYIRNKHVADNFVNYFPNATELTIRYNFFKPSDNSFMTSLYRIVPLAKITKLVITLYTFPFEQMIELIRLTPSLHTLKSEVVSVNEISKNLIKESDLFQYVSKTNQITNFELNGLRLENIQLFLDLFPQLEYLKIGINKKEIQQIIQLLFSKTNNKPQHLVFLCISEIPKRCLRELNMLIKSEHLLDDYFIKFINRNLYLWW